MQARQVFDRHWQDLGHDLLLKRYRDDILNDTPEEISKAALDTVPRVLQLFWTFRVMAGLGFYLIAFFIAAMWFSCKHTFETKRWFLTLALWTLPAPWIAIECGWFVAEYGRQPWAVEGVLPTLVCRLRPGPARDPDHPGRLRGDLHRAAGHRDKADTQGDLQGP